MKDHLQSLGGDRKFVMSVYHACVERGYQQQADEKLAFFNLSPSRRLNINDPTHDELSKEALRLSASWMAENFQTLITARSLLAGNACIDWEHFRT